MRSGNLNPTCGWPTRQALAQTSEQVSSDEGVLPTLNGSYRSLTDYTLTPGIPWCKDTITPSKPDALFQLLVLLLRPYR